MTRRAASGWCLAGVAAALALAMPASAQHGARTVHVRFDDGVPRVSFSVADLARADALRRKLESGLPQTVLVRVWARTAGGDREIARAARFCRVVYDLWSERWRVEVGERGAESTRALASLDAVVRQCFVGDALAVGDAEAWRGRSGQRVRFSVLVEVNPLSNQTVRRIKRWLAQPGGRGGLDGGDAFFGSFVALFVNRRVGEAEQAVRLASPAVTVP